MAPFLVDHIPVFLITALFVGFGYAFGAVTGIGVMDNVGVSSLLYGAKMGAGAVALVAGPVLIVFFLSRLIPWVRRKGLVQGHQSESSWAEYREFLAPRRLAGLFTVFVLLVPLMNTFSGFKGAIPEIQPFRWDVAFMQFDRALHLNHHPWEILHPWLGYPLMTWILDFFYYIWFPVKIVTLAWLGWSRGSSVRTQFFVTYFALWILLGTVLATALSSAGPCYFGLVTGEADPYEPLMQYLYAVNEHSPLTALKIQKLLWAGYTGEEKLVEGIAAMPSLHVALPVLYAIVGWRIHRWIGVAYALYTFVILLGSIHLGWHYAIDGYLVLLAVPVIWKVVGFTLRVYYRWSLRWKFRIPPGACSNDTVVHGDE